MKYLITIVGPTAIGKTALSIALAKYYNCEIISCDSRQFYKEMSIGTAVPTDSELENAAHHFIQNRSIFDNYTVGDFEKEAITKLEELYTNNDFAIVVGGSGLYVDAILKGFDKFPEINPLIREQIHANYDTLGIAYLQGQLKLLDPSYHQSLTLENPQTLQNPQRMMRFVEVCLGTGQPYSSFLNHKQNNRKFTPIVIGLDAKREVIYDRINSRVDAMISEGLLNEAKDLFKFKELNALQTVGYRELFRFMEGEISLDFAIGEIKKNTRRFSKRQLTWFKRNQDTKWFDYDTAIDDIVTYVNLQKQSAV